MFDVKFDLTRKARLVADGHRNKDVPAHSIYASVILRDSVRIVLLLAVLNGLDILAVDIDNTYLNAPCKEKVHVIVVKKLVGPENNGKRAVIVHVLYELKSARYSWRHHLAQHIRE